MRFQKRFDILELSLVCAVIAVATWLVTHTHYKQRQQKLAYFATEAEAELAPLARRYGSSRFSANMEEWVIRDYFQDRREGVFLDVGANHYRDMSNTFFLETVLGWSGVAVDALEEFAADYRTHRPRTKFVAMFASDVADSTVQFFVAEKNKVVSSASREFTVKEGAPGVARVVPTTTLNAVLEQAGVSRIDFLSMDIELAEPKALAGFDIGKYQPSLVCIEGHQEVRQQILDYFARHGYTLIGDYLRADPRNLYFKPLAPSGS